MLGDPKAVYLVVLGVLPVDSCPLRLHLQGADLGGPPSPAEDWEARAEQGYGVRGRSDQAKIFSLDLGEKGGKGRREGDETVQRREGKEQGAYRGTRQRKREGGERVRATGRDRRRREEVRRKNLVLGRVEEEQEKRGEGEREKGALQGK